nr:hypothetical protein [Candidatus Kapabacteria bacterium]
ELLLQKPDTLNQIRRDTNRTTPNFVMGFTQQQADNIVSNINSNFCGIVNIERDTVTIRSAREIQRNGIQKSQYVILNSWGEKLRFTFLQKNNRWRCFNITTYKSMALDGPQ